jgi:hypothetical protein
MGLSATLSDKPANARTKAPAASIHIYSKSAARRRAAPAHRVGRRGRNNPENLWQMTSERMARCGAVVLRATRVASVRSIPAGCEAVCWSKGVCLPIAVDGTALAIGPQCPPPSSRHR